MTPSGRQSDPCGDRSWRPRFGLGGMMLVMLVFSVMAAAAFYMVRGLEGGGALRWVFVLFTLTAPVLLLVLASLLKELACWIRRRKRRGDLGSGPPIC